MTVKLEIRNITKYFMNNDEKLSVLENISFSIYEGEIVCILGPSGSGKSTLLRHIAGFETANSGGAFLNGNQIVKPEINRIMVFQDFNQLFPWMTVLENVIFPLRLDKNFITKTQRENIGKRYLKMVKIDGFENYYPHQLSGGMKQKVAIARSLVLNPGILLMDEPFASLDAQTRNNLQNLLLQIWEETGITVVFVTHDIQEAVLISDRIIIMDKINGNIKKIINNNIERPRTLSNVEFTKMVDEIYELLKQ